MKKIVLCYSRNNPYSYDAHTPLSILSLGTFLETKGVEVDYFDERVQPIGRFHELLAQKPALVGFSVIGGYQIASAARLSRAVRRDSPASLIVWGGLAPTTLPKETAAEDFVDAAVVGEGEQTLLELVRGLGAGALELSSVAGLVFRRDGGIVVNPPRPAMDMEELPFVYQGKAREMLRLYLRRKNVREMTGYETSRGCPFFCRFCYSPHFNRGNVRVKSLGKIAEELRSIRELGVDDFDVYDDTLLGGRQEEIPAFVDRLGRTGFRWIGNLRINMVSDGLIDKLEKSGCRWVYFGLESNDDRVLAEMRKGITSEQIRTGVEVMRRHRVSTVYSIVMGLPLESEDMDVNKYLDFADRLHALHPSAEIQLQSYVPLPGTDLYAASLRRGFRPPVRLLDWAELDHFGVTNPWIRPASLPRRLYLSSFLAYRYKRHLAHFPLGLFFYPFHRLALFRFRRRWFGFFMEDYFYFAALFAAKALTSLRFFLRDGGGRFGGEPQAR
ncbi:MAG TPA: radical SAM protein [Elusimicrobiota bacterium]|nr:radical SAM protein [Elusimicrobiota bacterium]